jgi:8-oxo-dGTP diphosphatase
MADSTQSSPGPARRGVVAVVARDERFLVIRRAAEVLAPRAFCFPGGGIEGNESEAEALVREFREELNAAIRPLRCIWRCTTRWNVALSWWLGTLDDAAVLVPNPAEVESVHWFSSGEMRAQTALLESNLRFLDALAADEIRLH